MKNIRLIIVFTCLMMAGYDAFAAMDRSSPKLNLEISYENPLGSDGGANQSIHITIKNRGKKKKIRLSALVSPAHMRSVIPSSTAIKSIVVPAGEINVELPIVITDINAMIDMKVHVDGDLVDDLGLNFTVDMYVAKGKPNSPTVLVLGSNEDYQHVSDGLSNGLKEMDVVQMDTRRTPKRWQEYLGFLGPVMLNASFITRLSFEQREALGDFVRWGGGTLWIYGSREATRQAANELELTVETPNRAQEEVKDGIFSTHLQPTGLLILANEDCPGQLNINTITSLTRVAELRALFMVSTNQRIAQMGNTSWFGDLFADLHNIPRGGYVLISILLAIFIGPVNLIILRKKKKIALFYVTAPVLAILGMILLAGYSVINEGLGVKINEQVLLLHDMDSGMGAVYHGRGVFAGLTPSDGLSFPDRTAVFPVSSNYYRDDGGRELVTDYTSGQRLVSGWVKGRELGGTFTVTPKRVRLKIDIKEDVNTMTVANGLTSALNTVIARDVNGKIYQTSNVPPGQSKIMQATNPNVTIAVPFMSFEHLSWKVMASVDEGLDHTEDGGLKGSVLNSQYVYVGLSAGQRDKVKAIETLKYTDGDTDG